ncbi:hypothetical protein [Streptococcus gallolyticus]|nr:hypothetical protein [Streptococcus gallolyticus]QBX16166.1 hypothetical protein Javan235_0027 [Streptococcus phage Javan235]
MTDEELLKNITFKVVEKKTLTTQLKNEKQEADLADEVGHG